VEKWTELVDALNSGKVDGASMLIELAMKAKEQGIDLKAVALGHRDGNVVVVSKDINKVEDLKGKSFAIPSKLLKNHGLAYNDVNKQNRWQWIKVRPCLSPRICGKVLCAADWFLEMILSKITRL